MGIYDTGKGDCPLAGLGGQGLQTKGLLFRIYLFGQLEIFKHVHLS